MQRPWVGENMVNRETEGNPRGWNRDWGRKAREVRPWVVVKDV